MAHQPFNLKNVLLWAAIALGGFTFQACSNDDDYPTVDGQNPTISLTSDLIHAEPGRTFNITGKISDADGIKSIRLKNEGMLLDKTSTCSTSTKIPCSMSITLTMLILLQTTGPTTPAFHWK